METFRNRRVWSEKIGIAEKYGYLSSQRSGRKGLSSVYYRGGSQNTTF